MLTQSFPLKRESERELNYSYLKIIGDEIGGPHNFILNFGRAHQQNKNDDFVHLTFHNGMCVCVLLVYVFSAYITKKGDLVFHVCSLIFASS